MKRLNLSFEKGIIDSLTTGILNHCTIYHDDTCVIYNSKECNCDPDIIIKTKQGNCYVQYDGTLFIIPSNEQPR